MRGQGIFRICKGIGCGHFLYPGKQAPGGTDRAGPSRLPPVLELCRM